jgi:methyl-accepting chemotaxis protein
LENEGRITGSQGSEEATVSQTVVERTAEQIGKSARQASRASSAIADAIEDGVGVVRRATKQGGDAAEEFLDDTTERLQRHLLLTVATTFAVGVTAGTLIGWMMKRR